MPRTKNAQPPLTHIEDDRKVGELGTIMAHYEREVAEAHQALDAAKRAMEQAHTAVAKRQVDVLTGKATDADLAVEQSKLLEAQREYQLQQTRLEQAETVVRLMPAEIDEAKCAARFAVARTLRAQYQPAVERLRAALLAAKEASDEVSRLYDQAYREFTAGVDPHFHCAVIDLGTHGLTTTAAGLQPLAWDDQFAVEPGRGSSSRFDRWLAEADALLGRLPTMEQADIALRERAEAHLLESARLEREKLARLAAVERHNAEKWAAIFLEARGIQPGQSGAAGQPDHPEPPADA